MSTPALPVQAPAAVPAGSLVLPHADPADGGLAVHIEGGGPSTAAGSLSVVSPAPTARAVLIASAALPAAGAYAATVTTAIPAGSRRASIYITYTRGGAGGYALFLLYLGDGTELGQVVLSDGTYNALVGMVPSGAGAVQFDLPDLELLGGQTRVGIAVAEGGNTGSPGTLAAAITFG